MRNGDLETGKRVAFTISDALLTGVVLVDVVEHGGHVEVLERARDLARDEGAEKRNFPRRRPEIRARAALGGGRGRAGFRSRALGGGRGGVAVVLARVGVAFHCHFDRDFCTRFRFSFFDKAVLFWFCFGMLLLVVVK